MAEEMPAAPKPRSAIERAIVWGVIAIGVIVVGLEAKAHFTFNNAYTTLQDKIAHVSESTGAVSAKDVQVAVGGMKPTSSRKLTPPDTGIGAGLEEIYAFPGILRTRELYVYYGVAGKAEGDEADVIAVGTQPEDTQAEMLAKLPPPTPADPSATPAGAPGMMGGQPGGAPGGMAGPGGPGGGRGDGSGPGDGSGGGGGRKKKPATDSELKDAAPAEAEATPEEPKETPPAEEKPADEKPADDKPAEEKSE